MRDYSRTEITETVEEWILNERDRKVILRRLLDGITYERLAEEFDMSVTQIKRIVYKTQEKVFRHLPK